MYKWEAEDGAEKGQRMTSMRNYDTVDLEIFV